MSRKYWDPRQSEARFREQFLDGYLDAAIRQLAQREPLRDHSIRDVTMATLRQIEETADAFLAENWEDLRDRDLQFAGRQFYAARNGDRLAFDSWDWPDPSAPHRLRKSALEYGWHHLYFDLDGMIRAEYQ